MVSQIPGRGAAYEVAFNNADGKPLSGDNSYKVTLPPNVPAALFWSLTLYEAENASGLATEARRFPSLGSCDKPVQNSDGQSTSTLVRKRPIGNRRIGSPPLRGVVFSPSCGSMGRLSEPSTTVGSRGTSKNKTDVRFWPGHAKVHRICPLSGVKRT